jgi:hypothetical protein
MAMCRKGAERQAAGISVTNDKGRSKERPLSFRASLKISA